MTNKYFFLKITNKINIYKILYVHRNLYFRFFTLLLFLVLCSAEKAIESESTKKGQAALHDAVAAWHQLPPTDKTPVYLVLGGIEYSIPRNYIISLSNWNGPKQSFIGLRVTFPELKPFTSETESCFVTDHRNHPSNCALLEVSIMGIGPPSVDQIFENLRHIFNNQVPLSGPSGLEMYETGKPIVLYNTYRVGDRKPHSLYECILAPQEIIRMTVCSVTGDATAHGPGLHYFFPKNYLDKIEIIDSNLRKIIDEFVIETGK